MKKTLFPLLTGLFICLGITQVAHADDYLRIGMEAAYAPFNWTQEDDANGAVKIDGIPGVWRRAWIYRQERNYNEGTFGMER